MKPDKPTLVMGQISFKPTGTTLTSLNRDTRETTLLYQQKVAALIECARAYAHDPSDATAVRELLRVAAAFAENV